MSSGQQCEVVGSLSESKDESIFSCNPITGLARPEDEQAGIRTTWVCTGAVDGGCWFMIFVVYY